jgi:CubicO group peptidase (beta-lactamase class C family)
MDGSEAELAAALSRIRGVRIDERAARAHVIRPEHVLRATSDRGRAGVPAREFHWPPFPFYRFDKDGFIKTLRKKLTGEAAGYSVRLTERGATIATIDWNWGKEPQDGGESWTPGVRMHVASLSKIMTAIAMTRLLDGAGIPPSTPIIGYLPDYWVKGPNVDQITFAELLTHTSGLAYQDTTSHSDFEFMKSHIAAGTTHVGEYNYQNMNFGLCRILLATINGNISADWSLPGFLAAFNDLFWDFITITAYSSYVADHLFAPAGVTGPGFTHATADALAYNFPVAGNGWNSGNLTTMAGAAGWHMSVEELLRVMTAFRDGGSIVSASQAQAMLADGFGIDWTVPTPLGTYYAKNGFWFDGAGQMEQGVAFFLPLDMELVVLVNSPVGPIGSSSDPPGQFLYTVVSDAYLENIVEVV